MKTVASQGPGSKPSKWLRGTAIAVASGSAVILMGQSPGNAALLGYHLGRFVAFFFVVAIAAYLIGRLWKPIKSSVLALAVIVAALGTVLTASGGGVRAPDGREFLPEARMVAWMSRDRTICVNLDQQSQTCEGAIKVHTTTDKQVDVTLLMIAATDGASSIKVALPSRSDVTARGFCTTVHPEDLVFQFYGSRDTVGVIGPNDQVIPLTPEMQQQGAQFLRMGGAKAGDVLCERYLLDGTHYSNIDSY